MAFRSKIYAGRYSQMARNLVATGLAVTSTIYLMMLSVWYITKFSSTFLLLILVVILFIFPNMFIVGFAFQGMNDA